MPWSTWEWHTTTAKSWRPRWWRRGELRKADEVLETIFGQRTIPLPLQDYAYNMLIGLPKDAVLITNGDNDTFPPLALQAGMKLRPDVIVVNRSLLNLRQYAESVFNAHPSIRPDYDIRKHKLMMVDGHPTLLSSALIKAMIAERKAPVYFAASVNDDDFGLTPETNLEGINLRAGNPPMPAERSARLFLQTYRLDSATDWSFAWSLALTLGKLMRNYPAAMITLAKRNDVSKETKEQLLARPGILRRTRPRPSRRSRPGCLPTRRGEPHYICAKPSFRPLDLYHRPQRGSQPRKTQFLGSAVEP